MLHLGLVLLALVGAASAGVVGIDIQRREDFDYIQHDRVRLGRRQISQTLDNFQILYFANITLGTPPQVLRMLIDTGSSDLWCNTPQSTLCSTVSRKCAISGTYDSKVSSSYKFLSSDFTIRYLDGSSAEGDYVTDTINLGGQTLPDFQFGVGNISSSTEGVLGIGYTINEAQVNWGSGDPYANLPQRMVDQGLIQTNAYSLWLNDLGANTGQILFGGINVDKYQGSLQSVPIMPVEGQYSEMLIALSSISVDGASISSTNLPAGVLLDAGSTLMYLPKDVASVIHNKVQAVVDGRFTRIPTAYVPCALANQDKTVDLTFSGVKISVPFNELVLPTKGYNGTSRTFRDGRPACTFGISSNQGGSSILGDTFLRSAYVVYDLANNRISLAQTNFNSTTDNIKEIEVGPDGVPDAIVVPDAIAEVKEVATGPARLAAVATPTRWMVSRALSQAPIPAGICLTLTLLLLMGLMA